MSSLSCGCPTVVPAPFVEKTSVVLSPGTCLDSLVKNQSTINVRTSSGFDYIFLMSSAEHKIMCLVNLRVLSLV